jgi:mannitol-1-phosphate 5-dehydrogenase
MHGARLHRSLLVQSGHHLVFADIHKQLIDLIIKHRQYPVHIPEGTIPLRTDNKNPPLVSSHNIIDETADPVVVIITAPVGVGILLTKGIKTRVAQSTKLMRNQLVRRRSSRKQSMSTVRSRIGSMWSRPSASRLVPWTDSYRLSITSCHSMSGARVSSVRGPVSFVRVKANSPLLRIDRGEEGPQGAEQEGGLDIEGMLTDDLKGYVERTLFTLNTCHAITMYLGVLEGYKTMTRASGTTRCRSYRAPCTGAARLAWVKKHTCFNATSTPGISTRSRVRFKNLHIRDDVAWGASRCASSGSGMGCLGQRTWSIRAIDCQSAISRGVLPPHFFTRTSSFILFEPYLTSCITRFSFVYLPC